MEMIEREREIWQFLHRHLRSIFTQDVETYKATTSEDLSLYEWFVTPHRQDGLDFHFFMIEHSWAGTVSDFRYDLLEPRLQLYGDTAIVTYTFMLTIAKDGAISHRQHNESRVLIKTAEGWQVVHVHKSPAWPAPVNSPGSS
jgi:ketosteroid isomerase-like protein